jgi:acyl-CoA thioesterase I
VTRTQPTTTTPTDTARSGTGRAAAGTARLLTLLAVVMAVLLAACGPQDPGGDAERAVTQGASAAPSTAEAPQAQQPLYVAIGASESVGEGADDRLSQAWPQVLFRTALPRETVFINLAVPGSTVADALTQQVPEAVRMAPAMVTVWLNVNDLLAGVRPSDYERRLETLVKQLRRGGSTKVLLANTPPLDHLPSYQACLSGSSNAEACPLQALARLAGRPLGQLPTPARLNALTAEYNRATAKVAAAQGAILVDLHAAGLAARSSGAEQTLVGRDGFHPSTAGHKAVAAAFAEALRASGG